MDLPGGRDARFNPYGMNLLTGEPPSDIYASGRPSTSLQQQLGGGGGAVKADVCYDGTPQAMSMDVACVGELGDDTFASMQVKKSPPSNGKKTKGRVKIKMEYIENKLRRYTTFSKRKTGIMKKAYELSTLTGTQVMLLVASETGHVYTFATRKLQPMITSDAGKALIQTCLNSPDPPPGSGGAGSGGGGGVGSGGGGGGGGGGAASVDQRMSATGFEETELTYNISDEDSKDENMSTVESSADSGASDCEPPLHDEQEYRIPTTTSPMIATITTKSNSTSNSNTTATNTTTTTNTPSSKSTKTTPIISPLVYPTPQGVMYATPASNGGMLFSLTPPTSDSSLGGGQFITIPISAVMTAATTTTGQGELDLSKRK